MDIGAMLLTRMNLAIICAIAAMLLVHRLAGADRTMTLRWACGALLVWGTGARLWSWLHDGGSWQNVSDLLHFWTPGYAASGGLTVLLLWTLWFWRKTPRAQQRTMAIIMVISGLWWGLEHWRLRALTSPLPALPAMTLDSLQGQPVPLISQTHTSDVLILWRSDCLPCRELLRQLAEHPPHEEVSLILINQGESLLTATRYLDQARHLHQPSSLQTLGLEEDHLLLDPRQRLQALAGSAELPIVLRVQDGRLSAIARPPIDTRQLARWLQ